MGPWQRLVGDRPIVTRLVLAVAAAMMVVLLAASALVYWRVAYALNRQLDQDLSAWHSVVSRGVRTGVRPPTGLPGLTYQVYDESGALVEGDPAGSRLASRARLERVRGDERYDLGGFLPPPPGPVYRVQLESVATPQGRRFVASAISRAKHDEALRELLLQLGLAALATLAAASLVGYRTARAALDPVEAYRRAAQQAGERGSGRLPVRYGHDDELTRLGHTFNGMLDRLDDAAERERRFLADASHELRAPLSLMSTELEWARHRRRTPEQLERVLESMQQQTRRLVRLSDALLDVEELRAGRSLPREEVALGEALGRTLREAGLADEVQVDVPDVRVEVNPRWTGIAVVNLVVNALRHGRPPVRLTASWSDPWLHLVVRDAGEGFAPDFRGSAFERFSRAEESRSTPGSGLGLSLVRAVAEAHGGSARILQDEPGGAVELWLRGRP